MDQVSGNFLWIPPFGGAWLTQVTLGAVSDDPFVGNAPHGVLFFFFRAYSLGSPPGTSAYWFGSGFLPLGIAHDLPSLARWGSGVDPGKQLVPSPADAAGGHLNRPGQTARVGIAADRELVDAEQNADVRGGQERRAIGDRRIRNQHHATTIGRHFLAEIVRSSDCCKPTENVTLNIASCRFVSLSAGLLRGRPTQRERTLLLSF